MNKQDVKNLKKRYLIWFYKTVKEAVDKTERKFTQAEIDRFILKDLKAGDKSGKLQKHIFEFEIYVQNKEKQGAELKFINNDLNPNYQFLVLKLKAVEKAIVKELGKSALNRIKALYEEEMTQRILKSTEH
jgi:hypothetical protein